MPVFPTVPETITVHLGPPNSSARNVTVPFVDYIKNVASSEIYPTWPDSSLRANIYAQISFALNRIYTEWYRSRGYDFDITSSTAYDQSYTYGRDTFESTNRIAEEIFNKYIVRQGSVEPLFAQFCNGTTVTCEGLSQWGSVTLAERGYNPYSILQYYYGDDININTAPVANVRESYPGAPLRRGSGGDDVRSIQTKLNRIGLNYPAIPKISPVNSVFDENTENAVRSFQRIFNLSADGIVGEATWYKINQIYNGVKRIAEIDSEGIKLEEVSRRYADTVKEGDSGQPVSLMQYYLATIALVNSAIPPVTIDGYFGPATTSAVRAFQQFYGLNVDGIIGRQTWNKLNDVYRGVVDRLPQTVPELRGAPFGGSILSYSDEGTSVEILQFYLSEIANAYPIAKVSVDGKFGAQTTQAVLDFQRLFGLEQTGVVTATVWYAIADAYTDLVSEGVLREGQFPGRVLTEGD